MHLSKRGGVFLCIVVLLLSGSASTVAQTNTYTISSPDSLDTPDKTVNVDGESYAVSKIIRQESDSPITVTIDAPTNADYDLYLYNHKRQIVATKEMSGSGTTEFETGYLDAGSYILGVYGSNGTFKDVVPVVISGYEVTVDAPTSVGEGSAVDVTAELTELRETSSPSKVEVVISQNEEVVSRITAAKASSEEYTAMIEDLDSGAYTLHVNVRGTEEAQGEKQILGVSDSTTVTVSTTTTSEENEAEGGSNGHTGGSSADDQTTIQTSTTASSSSNATATQTESSSTTTQPSITTTTSTTDSVLTPSQETTPATTDSVLPNYGLHLLALLLIVAGFSIRIHN